MFNDPGYWTDLPAIDDAASTLSSLKKSLNVSVRVFTHRPWPDPPELRAAWCSPTLRYLDVAYRDRSVVRHVRKCLVKFGCTAPIVAISKAWLATNGVPYDRLTIERNSETVSDPQARFKNRFHIARKWGIRFFIEDDWEKAIKLAYVCDVVFPLDQPYNRPAPKFDRPEDIPSNIVRVWSWAEIQRRMRSYV